MSDEHGRNGGELWTKADIEELEANWWTERPVHLDLSKGKEWDAMTPEEQASYTAELEANPCFLPAYKRWEEMTPEEQAISEAKRQKTLEFLRNGMDSGLS